MSMASQAHVKSGGERTASVRLTVEQHDRLRAVAEKQHRTLSQEIRRLVEQHLEREAA